VIGFSIIIFYFLFFIFYFLFFILLDFLKGIE